MKDNFDFKGIDHIGIAVKDIESAKNTYHNILGFHCSGEEILESRGLKVYFLETGNSRIELLGEINENSEIKKFLKSHGEGIHHICICVKDIQKTVEKLKKEDIKIINNGISCGASGKKIAFLHPKSTNGVLLELVEDTHGK